MATWAQVKTQAATEFNRLNTLASNTKIDSLVSELNVKLKSYIDKAGISASTATNPNYNRAQAIFQQLADLQNGYASNNKFITTKLTELTSSADIQNKLRRVGTLKDEIAKLERDLEQTKQEADTSRTRQSTVETAEREQSWYQGFAARTGIQRPLHRLSIAILFSFGLLCLFFSGLMLREFFTPSEGSVINYAGYTSGLNNESMFSVFSDSRFWSVASGITFVIVIVGILAASGRLGKLV